MAYNPVEMANLPATTEAAVQISPFEEMVAKAITDGKSPAQIARSLSGGDPRKRKTIYKRIRRLIYRDDWLHHAMDVYRRRMAVETMLAGPALAARAKRGRVDAQKLMLEVSGIHNPKVSHEHSGDINLRFIAMPRPDAADQTQLEPAEVVDATVVEDE
jgi:hypothetical protein